MPHTKGLSLSPGRRLELGTRRAEHREIGGGIATNQGGSNRLPAVETHAYVVVLLDNVMGRDNDPIA
jgi:hypothetical protein